MPFEQRHRETVFSQGVSRRDAGDPPPTAAMDVMTGSSRTSWWMATRCTPRASQTPPVLDLRDSPRAAFAQLPPSVPSADVCAEVLQSVKVIPVLPPESFRDGCSFGARPAAAGRDSCDINRIQRRQLCCRTLWLCYRFNATEPCATPRERAQYLCLICNQEGGRQLDLGSGHYQRLRHPHSLRACSRISNALWSMLSVG
ncbi:hypothetical protein SAMN05444172_8394 [Burkholderia sp. GAS332]|nr:hypothetical protein SAMN05444172_8394 [Burkholderia sp. GAS332]